MTTSGDSGPRPTAHIPALDGLRGIAILMVLCVHFYKGALLNDSFVTLTRLTSRVAGAGRYGVELFFVLSGFLITGILLDGKGRQHALASFYARRFLRIFPLYYAALAVVFYLLPLMVSFDEGASLLQSHQVWLWSYLTNFPPIPVDIEASQVVRLGHFWSLAVEEHFYLVWPLLVYLLPRPGIIWCGVLLLILGAGTRAVPYVLLGQTPAIALWTTLTRIDGLALGALLAVGARTPGFLERLVSGRWFRMFALFLAGSFMALVSIPLRLDVPVASIFGETVVVGLAGVVLVTALRAEQGTRWRRLLCSPVLTSFGTYSYGIYVIHGIARPFFDWLFNIDAMPPGDFWKLAFVAGFYVPAIALSYGAAYLSYHVFEKHFLNLKRHFV